MSALGTTKGLYPERRQAFALFSKVSSAPSPERIVPRVERLRVTVPGPRVGMVMERHPYCFPLIPEDGSDNRFAIGEESDASSGGTYRAKARRFHGKQKYRGYRMFK